MQFHNFFQKSVKNSFISRKKKKYAVLDFKTHTLCIFVSKVDYYE